MRLTPYQNYKASGVEWLEEVPAHWEMRRTNTVLCERNQKGFPNEPMLAATQTKGVIRKDQYENRTVLALKGFHLLKLVCVGDFVISLRSFQGGIEYAREQGIISPAYTILFAKNLDDHGFLSYLFKSNPYIENLGLFITGIRQGQNIDYEKLGHSPLPLPPLSEQGAIVRYLGYFDRRIRRYIREKQKLIKLLEEQKQAIIQRAVTRGLNPDVPLKDSGVAWLGDVPAHWDVLPLKHWAGMNNAVLPEYTDADFTFDYLDIGSVGTGVLVEKPKRIRFGAAPSRARRVVKSGDTIVSTVRTYLKAVWYAENTENILIVSTGFMVITPRNGTLPKFVSYLLQSNFFTDRVTAESVGIAYPAIAESRLGTFHLSIPPLSEQIAIVEYLDKVTTDIDAKIALARQQTDLMHEYRTRLIADVVTGKLDVRKAAAELPDEPDKPEA